MNNIILSKTVNLNVKTLKIEKEVPSDMLIDFKDWLIYKGIELGTGKHHDYYSFDEDYKNDIGVLFEVYIK